MFAKQEEIVLMFDRKAYYKAYNKVNKEKIKAKKKAWEEANKEKRKAYREANKEKRKAQIKAWHQANKEKMKAWEEANREKRKAQHKAWRVNNKEKRNAINKAWKVNNKEKINALNKAWYEANKEKVRGWSKAWEEANKDKRYVINANRRAAKLNRTPSWLTKEDLEEIKEIYRMARRRSEVEGIQYHVDHIIPLQGKNISGLHVPSNLQILRAKDNISKGNKYV